MTHTFMSGNGNEPPKKPPLDSDPVDGDAASAPAK